MKRTYRQPKPTALQRAKDWCFNNVWSVFGDHLPGMPYWTLTAHDDYTIMAHTDTVHPFKVGDWAMAPREELIVCINHDYPVIGIADHDEPRTNSTLLKYEGLGLAAKE
jgi:hypothetical protein